MLVVDGDHNFKTTLIVRQAAAAEERPTKFCTSFPLARTHSIYTPLTSDSARHAQEKFGRTKKRSCPPPQDVVAGSRRATTSTLLRKD